jgi:hypothetical protein
MTAKDQRIVELEAEGYVVLRAKSYRLAEERRRIAECRTEWAERDAEHAREWAREAWREHRRLADRCTFLYGAAIEHGATQEGLGGDLFLIEQQNAPVGEGL